MQQELATMKLISAQQLGEILNLSKRQVFRLNSSGKIPSPKRIGGSVRWLLPEIEQWIAADTPDRSEWENRKGALGC